MVANSYLEIYTLIFGWKMYGAIWDVLAGSGLALIPIIAAVISNFVRNYENGDAKSSIRGLEMNVLGMILVLMLCVMPFRGFNLTLASVDYNFNVPDCGLTVNPGNEVAPGDPPAAPSADATGGTGNATGTAFDATGMAGSLGGLTVHKPVAWSFVEFLSSAITHSTIKAMGCVNNYEMMLMRVSQISITDTTLRARLRHFTEHCYNIAKLRYEENPIAIAPNVNQWDDIDWIGSRILLNTQINGVDEYYRHATAYMQGMDQFGFQRQTVARASDRAESSGANPYCHEVWNGEANGGTAAGLRQLLIEHIHNDADDANGDILDDWEDWGSQVLTVGQIAVDLRQDLLLKMVLQGHASNLDSATEVSLANDFEADTSFWSGVGDLLVGAGGLFTSVDEFFAATVMKQMVKIVGPMILALIQMVVIMGAVFVMVMGKYKLESFIAVALTYFAFEFVNAIWAAAFWFDQQILDLYLSQAGYIDIMTNTVIVKAVSAGAVIVLPGIWLSLIAYAGAGMVRGMGAMGVGGGAAMGSGVGGGAQRMAGGVGYKGMAKGGNKLYGGAKTGVNKLRGK